MNMFKFEYINNKDYRYLLIPAHSEECAKFKANKFNVLTDEKGPVIIEVGKELNKDWR